MSCQKYVWGAFLVATTFFLGKCDKAEYFSTHLASATGILTKITRQIRVPYQHKCLFLVSVSHCTWLSHLVFKDKHRHNGRWMCRVNYKWEQPCFSSHTLPCVTLTAFGSCARVHGTRRKYAHNSTPISTLVYREGSVFFQWTLISEYSTFACLPDFLFCIVSSCAIDQYDFF